MDEKLRAQFIQWLGKELGAETEDQLDEMVASMDEDMIERYMGQFQQETQAQAFKKGGQINYMKKLKTYKKGGSACSASIKNGTASTRKVHSAVGGYKPSKKWDFGKGKQDRKETKKLTLNSLVNTKKIQTK